MYGLRPQKMWFPLVKNVPFGHGGKNLPAEEMRRGLKEYFKLHSTPHIKCKKTY